MAPVTAHTRFFSLNDPEVDRNAVQDLLGLNPWSLFLKSAPGSYLIYCDGACSGNGTRADAPGGWGIVVIDPQGQIRLGRGGARGVTNNKMELTAAIEALAAVPRGEQVTLITDSQYVIKGCTEWRAGWVKRGMKNSKGEEVLNGDYWHRLWAVADERRVKFQWVRGHNGDPGNELADRLAVAGAALR